MSHEQQKANELVELEVSYNTNKPDQIICH